VTFSLSNKEIDIDGAKTLMEAICHTCTVPLVSGKARDLRNGTEYDEHNEKIQTCITAAAGDVVIEA
jgi:hypothetical protein